MSSPFKTIKQFIEAFDDADELKKFIEVLKDTAFSSSIADDWTSNFRSDLIFYCRQIGLLIDAIFIIGQPIIELFEISQKTNNEKN